MKKIWKYFLIVSINALSCEIYFQEAQAASKPAIAKYKKFKVYKGGRAYEMMRHSKANGRIYEKNLVEKLPVRTLKFGEVPPPVGGKVPETIYQPEFWRNRAPIEDVSK